MKSEIVCIKRQGYSILHTEGLDFAAKVTYHQWEEGKPATIRSEWLVPLPIIGESDAHAPQSRGDPLVGRHLHRILGDFAVNFRQPRLLDSGYLAWLRTCICAACGCFPPCDAAHIRSGSPEDGKPPTGMGEKPSDFWAVSLCRSCHMKQHSMNEMEFWQQRRKDPFKIAIQLYRKYGGRGGKIRPPRKIRPRKPKEQRQKIQSRGFQK